MMYPLLQALDEQYLDVDVQFGGVDQRKIFTFAEEYLPLLGYKKRIHFMNPMVPSLSGVDSKMSSSTTDSKIDLLDHPNIIMKKLNRAFCEPGNIENNPVLSFCELVIFPLLDERPFIIKRQDKYGGNIKFDDYEELSHAFVRKELFPTDLKNAVTSFIVTLLEPLRKIFESPEMKELVLQAYPNA